MIVYKIIIENNKVNYTLLKEPDKSLDTYYTPKVFSIDLMDALCLSMQEHFNVSRFNLQVNLLGSLEPSPLPSEKSLFNFNKEVESIYKDRYISCVDYSNQKENILMKMREYNFYLSYDINTPLESRAYTPIDFNPNTILNYLKFSNIKSGIDCWDSIKISKLNLSDFDKSQDILLLYIQIFLYFYFQENNFQEFNLEQKKQIQQELKNISSFFSNFTEDGYKVLKLIREDVTNNLASHIANREV